tara:strand:+ start:756 stop:1889 length:1134 start_codon:yes stop_codon:yes gene_type:complete
MAVYKLFPYKDTTVYSLYPDMNTGIDAITSTTNLNIAIDSAPQVSRFLTEFSQGEIKEIIDRKIGDKDWDVRLKSFIATAQGVVESTDLEIHPVGEYWYNGTGMFLDVPQTTDGASWYSPNFKGGGGWLTGGNDPMNSNNTITSSFNSFYVGAGGGNWFEGYKVTQSFDTRSTKDLDVPVKNIVEKWSNEEMSNYGFIIKWEDSIEWNENTQIQPVMQFYSVDTNTIYPPQLEFKWDDYETVLTGSATGSILETTNIIGSLSENPGEFLPESIHRFRFNVANKYPIKTFTTASRFTGVNYLPTSSQYAVKDLDTNEFVINFDDTYTKLSSDSEGNYFDIYMNGLEPERYYKILVKTTINNTTMVLDDNYYFKVVNGF